MRKVRFEIVHRVEGDENLDAVTETTTQTVESEVTETPAAEIATAEEEV